MRIRLACLVLAIMAPLGHSAVADIVELKIKTRVNEGYDSLGILGPIGALQNSAVQVDATFYYDTSIGLFIDAAGRQQVEGGTALATLSPLLGGTVILSQIVYDNLDRNLSHIATDTWVVSGRYLTYLSTYPMDRSINSSNFSGHIQDVGVAGNYIDFLAQTTEGVLSLSAANMMHFDFDYTGSNFSIDGITGYFDNDSGNSRVSVTPIPEPSSWALLMGGFLGIGRILRRPLQSAARGGASVIADHRIDAPEVISTPSKVAWTPGL
jgi:hypothetical protein